MLALLCAAFLVYFYASDLKGIWGDEALRLTIANGGIPATNLSQRHAGNFSDVLKAVSAWIYQPAYFLVVNGILRIAHSYSVIPILTANLIFFLISAVGIYSIARRFYPVPLCFLSLAFYVCNGFAMVHVLQVREYPLIILLLTYNTLLYYKALSSSERSSPAAIFFVSVAHCLTAIFAYYTSRWAVFFLWPEGVIAVLNWRRSRRGALAVLISLSITACVALPSLWTLPKTSVVFVPYDKAPQTIGVLLSRLHAGSEYVLIGYLSVGRHLLAVYYWLLLGMLLLGLGLLTYRFFVQRFEFQHLILTISGFLAFQVCYFSFRDPLSTWPRYFIFYLPYLALFLPVSFRRAQHLLAHSQRHRTWTATTVILVVLCAGGAQLQYNYRHPFIDHGPDFRLVYQYLIERVAPRDKIVVGITDNRMALLYYWPIAHQVQLRYQTYWWEERNPYPNIWAVSFRDEKSAAYRAYAKELAMRGYKLASTKLVSRVTIRQFQLSKWDHSSEKKPDAHRSPTES